MYPFIRAQYLLGNIDADKVRSYVPRWITAEQAGLIMQSREDNIENGDT